MDTSPQATLHRSATNRVVAGVAGGLGEYFKIDPTLVRVVFVILTIWHLLGPLIYIVLWVIMPEAERSATDKPAAADNVATGMAPSTTAPSYIDGRSLGGLAIIAVGIFILLNNLGIYWDMQWNILWPFLLIVGGVLFLLRR